MILAPNNPTKTLSLLTLFKALVDSFEQYGFSNANHTKFTQLKSVDFSSLFLALASALSGLCAAQKSFFPLRVVLGTKSY